MFHLRLNQHAWGEDRHRVDLTLEGDGAPPLLVAQLYASLGRGAPLGEAVTLARKNLADNPLREVVHSPLPLQDWIVRAWQMRVRAGVCCPRAFPRGPNPKAARGRASPALQ